MTIIANRVDGRLIHGQVANLWATKLNITRFLVIDDEVAQSDIDKQSLKLTTPSGIRLSVLPIEKAAHNMINCKYDSQRLIVSAKKPEKLLQVLDHDMKLYKLNGSNMSQT